MDTTTGSVVGETVPMDTTTGSGVWGDCTDGHYYRVSGVGGTVLTDTTTGSVVGEDYTDGHYYRVSGVGRLYRWTLLPGQWCGETVPTGRIIEWISDIYLPQIDVSSVNILLFSLSPEGFMVSSKLQILTGGIMDDTYITIRDDMAPVVWGRLSRDSPSFRGN